MSLVVGQASSLPPQGILPACQNGLEAQAGRQDACPTMMPILKMTIRLHAPAPIQVAIHPSQFPEKVQADLLSSLRARQINPKFHYDSHKQTQKWLELHQACSPSRTDPICAACYDSAFAAAVHKTSAPAVHLIGLGCGGGQKDTRLLRMLKENNRQLFYTPVDVSLAMVLVAHLEASRVVAASHPLVCDLSSAEDLASVFDSQTPVGAARLITFFGMIPNFEPQLILPKLAGLFRRDDLLLFSANLAPGKDYAAGVRQIQPLYDNALTNDWLLTFLFDLGVERTDGHLEWSIESCPAGHDLLRLTAWFCFERPRSLRFADEQIEFGPGEKIRLFFSYRYTPDRVHDLLRKHGLAVQEEWIAASGEEGVFLCRTETSVQP